MKVEDFIGVVWSKVFKEYYCFFFMGERFVVMLLFAMLIVGTCFVDAFEADVLLIDDIGSFSGAVLRVKSPVTDSLGDKIYPSEYLTEVGIAKFEVDSSLSEVFLNFIIMNNGEVVAEITEGPFVLNGSEIVIDRREKAKVVEVTKVAVIEENVSREENVSEVVEENVFMNNAYGEEAWSIGFFEDVRFLYLIGGLLTFVVFMVMWFRFGAFRNWLTELNYFSEEGELARLESQIKKKDELIERIRENETREHKIKLARKKLELENEKLERMIRYGMSKKLKKFKK